MNGETQMDTRQIIDYAQEDNGVAFRDALYAGIHDRVSAHIEAKKQENAQTLIAPKDVPEQQDTEIENT